MLQSLEAAMLFAESIVPVIIYRMFSVVLNQSYSFLCANFMTENPSFKM